MVIISNLVLVFQTSKKMNIPPWYNSQSLINNESWKSLKTFTGKQLDAEKQLEYLKVEF